MMGKIRNDIILIITLLILIIGSIITVLIFSFNNDSDMLYVNIYKEDELLYSVSLDENKEYDINGKIGIVHVVIEDGYVYVSEAFCPNHICIEEGKKNHNNDMIVCLPNLIYIKIGGHIDE